MTTYGKQGLSHLLKWSLLASVALLPGCAMDDLGLSRSSQVSDARPLDFGKISIPKDRIRSEPQKYAAKGIDSLKAGRLEEASIAFNDALRLDPTNSYLHLLNGLSYHLRGLQGDGQMLDLAGEGYNLALRFDPSNWIARYHLGLLALDQKKYDEAKEHFAETLIYRSNDPDVLYNMVLAAYYGHDVPTAADMLKRLRLVETDTARVLRASAIVAAALDEPEEAERFIALYEAKTKDETGKAQIERRAVDWENFHNNFQQYVQKVQYGGSSYGGYGGSSGGYGGSSSGGYGSGNDTPVINPPSITPQGAQSSGMGGFGGGFGGSSGGFGGSSGGFGSTPSFGATPSPAIAGGQVPTTPGGKTLEDMVIVDVVLISTEEDYSTSKGINLLNSLNIQFGGGTLGGNPAAAFSSLTTSVSGNRTITRALTVPSITYSLNIANTNTSRSEILARPSLVGLKGQPSVFFSGVDITAAANTGGSAGGLASSAIQIQKEIGVRLGIIPNIEPDGRVRLQVEANRSFLSTPSADITFDFKLETTKTSVNANVLMNFGETLILSGLSEKETDRNRNGVPFLEEIPAVQYLFSNRTTRDFQRSVLVLLTPRLPQYVYKAGGVSPPTGDAKADEAMAELRARFADWFTPYPNWASVFHHMQANSLYREFRTGDVSLEHWQDQESLQNRLKTALDFLYY
ncbi:MAG TPA: hypothetical protein VGO34_02210 [Alphaproteobacteria bacterium]|jgi:general secretion pathway protein D